MKCIIGFLTAFLGLVSCEIADNYTEGYLSRYRRPIGLMMSRRLDSLSLSGEGVNIGVIDAGFEGFRENPYTKNLSVADYRDFVDGDTANFFGYDEHDHGTVVTSSIGGKNGEQIHGLAYDATYLLAKTEDVFSELSTEENRLVEAVDWLVSEGADVINLSIAYTTFDDTDYYSVQDLDGKTAFSSQYIDSVLRANPSLIITASAGNKGNKEWKYIMFPSDVEEIITVGSTDFDGESRWKSSGIGVDYVDYIKPDVVTYPIPVGNSHTAPVVAGLCAVLIEFAPDISRQKLIEALHKTSSRSDNPDREMGYGVPNSQKLLEYIEQTN